LPSSESCFRFTLQQFRVEIRPDNRVHRHRGGGVLKIFHILLVLSLALVTLVCGDSARTNNGSTDYSAFLCDGEYLGPYWPSSGWRTCRPEEVGMDSTDLMAVYNYAANPDLNTRGLLIVRKGYIVGEAYFRGYDATYRHHSYSVAKSFTSALIGIAINDGLIDSVGTRACEFFPQWQDDNLKKQITIRHILQMSTGLQWLEGNLYTDFEVSDVNGMGQSEDYLEYILNKPAIYAPETHWYYSSGNSMLLSGILEEATGMTAHEYALFNLLHPLGIEDIIWSSDPAGHTVTGWGIYATVREFAKFGYLYQNFGQWNDTQLVPRGWVEESVQPVSASVDFYGYHWWLRPAIGGEDNSAIPDDLFIAWGLYGQQIFVMPGLELVVVKVGRDAEPSPDIWNEADFLTLIASSIK
jgi:CubicO group peptidase (beta-lactamase class C family)